MSTTEERFELARQSVESIAQVAKDMHAIGVYDEQEYKAAALLLMTLTRAMVVLDPEKTSEYSKQSLAKATAELMAQKPEVADLFKSKGVGQYL